MDEFKFFECDACLELPKITEIPSFGLTEKEYRKNPYLNWSTLKRFAEAPNYFSHWKGQDTQSFRFGRAFHAYILRNEEFESEFKKVELPCKTPTAKANEIFIEKIRQEGKDFVTFDEFKKIQEMEKSLLESGLMQFFRDCNTTDNFENLYFCKKEFILLDKKSKTKGRLDCYHEKYGIIDLKTTKEIRRGFEDSFKWDINRYGYIGELVFYLNLMNAVLNRNPNSYIPLTIIAVESDPPFRSAIYPVRLESVDLWQNKIKNFCNQYKNYCSGIKISIGYGHSI